MEKEFETIINDVKKNDIESLMKKMHERDLQDAEKLNQINPIEFLYDNSGHMAGLGKTISIAEHCADILHHEFIHELDCQQPIMNHIFNRGKSQFKVLITDDIDNYRGSHYSEISEHRLDVSIFIKELIAKNSKYFDKTIIKLSEKPWLFENLI